MISGRVITVARCWGAFKEATWRAIWICGNASSSNLPSRPLLRYLSWLSRSTMGRWAHLSPAARLLAVALRGGRRLAADIGFVPPPTSFRDGFSDTLEALQRRRSRDHWGSSVCRSCCRRRPWGKFLASYPGYPPCLLGHYGLDLAQDLAQTKGLIARAQGVGVASPADRSSLFISANS